MSPGTPIDPDLQPLVAAAREAAQNSYSPYSRFRVGAAIELANGVIVTGTNVENVSYGLTICAEAAAIARAVAQHGPSIRIRAVAVTNLNNAPSPPCGACRQILSEFIEPDAPVAFATEDGIQNVPFRELLPLVFNTKVK